MLIVCGFPSIQDAYHVDWNNYNDTQFLAVACFIAHREKK